jgi:hypothetical protein
MAATLGVAQGFNFSVRVSSAVMPTTTDKLIPLYQDGADQRVGRSRTERAPGQTQT